MDKQVRDICWDTEGDDLMNYMTKGETIDFDFKNGMTKYDKYFGDWMVSFKCGADTAI